MVGASGSGKSTLMHLLAGARRADDGHSRRRHRAQRAERQRAHRSAGEHIGFVFQFFNLLPMLTADENIVLPLDDRRREPGQGLAASGCSTQVGLVRPPHPPPGRALRRPAAARRDRPRARHEPTVVFADEPTGNLDSQTGGEILELLRRSVDAYGQTTVMVTHDPRAAAIADRILFLADGLIVTRHAALRAARCDRGDGGATTD